MSERDSGLVIPGSRMVVVCMTVSDKYKLRYVVTQHLQNCGRLGLGKDSTWYGLCAYRNRNLDTLTWFLFSVPRLSISRSRFQKVNRNVADLCRMLCVSVLFHFFFTPDCRLKKWDILTLTFISVACYSWAENRITICQSRYQSRL